MNSVVRTFCIALLAFVLPITAVSIANWQDVRPYLIGDPNTATGELLFFTAPG